LSAGVQVPPTLDVQVPPLERLRSAEAAAGVAVLPLAVSVYALAVAATCLHVAFSGRYGYFRDELYYAACGQHLAWGYVDHAPLAPFLAQLSRVLLGDSLFALRFLPAVSAAAKVFLGGWIAREIGGGKFAQFFAAFCVFIAPIYLTFDNFFSMNAFEPVFWMACAAIVLRVLNGGNPRLWLVFGVVAGLGILNKHSMLFFGLALAIGLLLTPARRQFREPWIWLGAAIAFLLFLPNLVWEIRNAWPTVALLHAVVGSKYSTVAPWDYIWQQTLLTHPLAAPVWLAGLWFLLRDRLGRKYACLAWAYLAVLAQMLLLHGKIYYLAPAYIMLLAAGAVCLEARLLPRAGAWLRPVLVAPLAVGAIVAAPLAMPILPVQAAIRYCRFWDVQSVHVENVPQSDLPQLFGDMFGWEEQVAAIASAYRALPASEQTRTSLLAYNYGEAGAIDYFGPRYGLSPAISGHNQYGFWGPGSASDGGTVIAIGFPEADLRARFEQVEAVATVSPRYAMPEESGLTIFVCRRPKQRLEQLWPGLKWLG
jgi:dolichyl-phosphate-mannose-protein mannosyltransferase